VLYSQQDCPLKDFRKYEESMKKPVKFHERGKITRNQEVAPGYFLFAMEAPKTAERARPGQFVHLACSDQLEPFLRRPLSILYANDGEVGLLYKVVGEGTELLARRRPGETGDMIGPLGTTFQDEGEDRVLFVAGGIGVVPLVYFSGEMEQARKRLHFVYGAYSGRDLVLKEEVEINSRQHDYSTMDGSEGTRGTVIDVLNSRYGDGRPLPERIFACGPGPMLEAVRVWMEERSIPGQFSLENRMGCGIGACLGCVLPLRNREGYVRICHDGPVFDAQEVVCHLSMTE
jgi:dihydroorotate dehydrogenase electron transfer subunit